MRIVNRGGRQWDLDDADLTLARVGGACSIVSEDGHPLCGRVVDGEEPQKYVYPGWRAEAV
jgi:hypothetical protein